MIKLVRSDKHIYINDDLNRKINEKLKTDLNSKKNFVSEIYNSKELVILDKENSLLRVFDTKYNELRSIGSRLGYLTENTKERIGFEYPEDMSANKNNIIISDSGNNRVVILSKEYKYIKTINLPDSPFKFIHVDSEIIIVSDFFRSVFFISIQYGYLGKILIKKNIDFSTIIFERGEIFVADENGEYFNFLIEFKNIYKIAEYFNNNRVLMELLLDKSQMNHQENLRNIIKDDNELILVYLKKTQDHYFFEKISNYIETTVNSFLTSSIDSLKIIDTLSLEYFFVYKLLSTKGDQEKGELIKQKKIFSIFEKINQRRENFNKLIFIRESIKGVKILKDKYDILVKSREEVVFEGIKKTSDILSQELGKSDEETILSAICKYWLLFDEIKILFPEIKDNVVQFFSITNSFYNSILENFYFNLALLYKKNNNLEKFYFYAEKELLLYNDKINIMLRYTDILIALRDYDKALKILDRNIDKNKENINYRYYKILMGKNKPEAAIEFLKKELALFPHKKELIPELLKFDVLKTDEIKALIGSISHTDDQMIDTNYNVAMAYFEINENETGLLHLNRELELFPENKKAVLYKMNLFLNMIPDISKEVAEENFRIFINYLKSTSNEYLNETTFGFFTVFNFIDYSEEKYVELRNLSSKKLSSSFSTQIDIYLAFQELKIDETVKSALEKYEVEDYLVSISCSIIAFKYFFLKAKELFEKKKMDAGFLLIEKILTYNPGNKEIFEYLDKLGAN